MLTWKEGTCSSDQRRCSKTSIGRPEELVMEYRLCSGFGVDKGSSGEGGGIFWKIILAIVIRGQLP